jgi:hypothetical protein
MSRLNNLIGQKFGRLLVLKEFGRDKNRNILWECSCECGNTKITTTACLNHGSVISCGCKNAENRDNFKNISSKHNKSKTRIYDIWVGINQRIKNKNNKRYRQYGGRGIVVCEEWDSENENGFINFYNWSMENGYDEKLTIDRRDVNGNYEPYNCRWSDRETQMNNTTKNNYIEINGEIKTVSQWAKEYNIPTSTLSLRIKSGWSKDRLLIPPSNKKTNKDEVCNGN